VERPSSGVGTEIKNLLTRIGIPACGGCVDAEAELNRRGVPWCEENFQRLIDWLTGQAAKHNVSLVLAAIRLSFVEPRLAWKITMLKVRYPLTGLAELAAVGIVDAAIERASVDQKTQI
jgi:hypothetical protein